MTQDKGKTEKIFTVKSKKHTFRLYDKIALDNFKANKDKSLLSLLEVDTLLFNVDVTVNDKNNRNVKIIKSFSFDTNFTLADLIEHAIRNIKKETGNSDRQAEKTFTNGTTYNYTIGSVPETTTRKKEKSLSEMTLEELEARQAAIIAEIEAKKAQTE